MKAAKAVSDAVIQGAEAATLAAAGTPAAPGAMAAEQTIKATAAATMGSAISAAAGGSDIHACLTPLPIPPHGPGIVITPSKSVIVANFPAARLGDEILEAVGPPNKIVSGCMTVMIGD
jgi:uncharacterized Zn-binding protein involved in type VI secretion